MDTLINDRACWFSTHTGISDKENSSLCHTAHTDLWSGTLSLPFCVYKFSFCSQWLESFWNGIDPWQLSLYVVCLECLVHNSKTDEGQSRENTWRYWSRVGKMTLLVKCLPGGWEDLSLDHQSSWKKQGVLTHACNPKREGGGQWISRARWSAEPAQFTSFGFTERPCLKN